MKRPTIACASWAVTPCGAKELFSGTEFVLNPINALRSHP